MRGIAKHDRDWGGLTPPPWLMQPLSLPNTSYITNTYDNAARLTDTYLRTSGGTALNRHSYVYNNGNQRTKQTRQDGGYVDYLTMTRGRYIRGRRSPVAAENRGYNYDAAMNLTQATNNAAVVSYAPNSLNQITSDGNYGTTFDGNGNLIDRGSGYITYEYDDENQLTRITSSTAYRHDFVYDGRMRLRKRLDYSWVSGSWYPTGETRYLYDGMLVVQERNSANTPTVTYTRGNDLSGTLQGAGGIGGLLGRSHGYSGGSWSTHNHYHADGNGNVTYLVNSSQTIAASYKYDPFGRTISSSGTLASANTYRFSSKEINPNSGMYYYGYRFYSPDWQRWLNADPLSELGFELARTDQQTGLLINAEPMNWWEGGTYFGGPKVFAAELLPEGPNLYGFAHHNPVNVVDPFGDVSWGWPVLPPPGSPPSLPPAGPLKPPIDPCLNDCVKKCAVAHVPMRAACAVGCIGAGPGYAACFVPCQTAVTISQAVCTAACYAGSKL